MSGYFVPSGFNLVGAQPASGTATTSVGSTSSFATLGSPAGPFYDPGHADLGELYAFMSVQPPAKLNGPNWFAGRPDSMSILALAFIGLLILLRVATRATVSFSRTVAL